MLIIDSVRIRNFRAIKEARLVPLQEGITGIFGANGAGKTTFLTAVLFALYGVRPANVPVAALRREGSLGAECSVSVVFHHLGQTVEVIREIQGKANKTLVFIYVDGKEETTTSVGAADRWIESRLGIDAEGFMTAFVVRQKELDLLVSAKPAPRKQLIERLAGIENINIALKAARDKENASKKALTVMGGSLESYETAEMEFRESEIYISELLDDFTASKEKTDKAEERYDKLFSAHSAAKDKLNYVEALASKKEYKKAELDDLKERLTSSEGRLSGVTEQQVLSLQAELTELDTSLTAARENFNKTKNVSERATDKLESLAVERKKLEQQKKPVKPKGQTLPKLNEAIVDAEQRITSTQQVMADARAEIKANRSRIELVNHGACPTCEREWDNPTHETHKLDNEVTAQEKIFVDAETTLSALRSTLQELKQKVSAWDVFNREVQMYETNQARLKEIIETIDTITPLIVKEEVLEGLLNDGKRLAAERDEKNNAFLSAKTALSHQEEVKVLRTRVKTAEQELTELEEKFVSVDSKKPDISEIEIELREARTFRDNLRAQLETMQKDFDEENRKHYAIKSIFDVNAKEWAKKQESYKQHQQMVATTDVLDNFRKDAISRLAPELSDYATSLISDMTSGAFTEIILDEDFNPSVVTAAGVKRPVAWLSGGEESAVALALRLAIAFLITNGNPELLWLDEVLTAQDSDRRSSMLGMLRKLEISQILIINHTEEAGDVVDKAVVVIPSPDGSTLEEAVGN